IRRIKCDEGKPCCIRWVSTGRRCDGYEQPKTGISDCVPTHHHYILKIAVPKAPDGLLSDVKSRALQFFRLRTVSALSLAFGCEFTDMNVLIFGKREAYVHNGILAFNSFYETYEKTRSMGVLPD
ncbi:hypothetical protein BJ878DRAFT_414786, partial [Calycina marina]